jgi:hypothetical protein
VKFVSTKQKSSTKPHREGGGGGGQTTADGDGLAGAGGITTAGDGLGALDTGEDGKGLGEGCVDGVPAPRGEATDGLFDGGTFAGLG